MYKEPGQKWGRLNTKYCSHASCIVLGLCAGYYTTKFYDSALGFPDLYLLPYKQARLTSCLGGTKEQAKSKSHTFQSLTPAGPYNQGGFNYFFEIFLGHSTSLGSSNNFIFNQSSHIAQHKFCPSYNVDVIDKNMQQVLNLAPPNEYDIGGWLIWLI